MDEKAAPSSARTTASLAGRHFSRDFARDALPLPLLSDLLWAAYGVNRADGGRMGQVPGLTPPGGT